MLFVIVKCGFYDRFGIYLMRIESFFILRIFIIILFFFVGNNFMFFYFVCRIVLGIIFDFYIL